MRKFIFKTSLFTIPFILLYFANEVYYRQDEGDLIRLGFIYDNPLPKSAIDNTRKKISKRFTTYSELDPDEHALFSILSIGDSFSEQGNFGYNNYLASDSISVLYLDYVLSYYNPLQTLINLTNGDFFDFVDVDYVLLQSVERYLVERCLNVNFENVVSRDSIDNQLKGYTGTGSEELKQKIDFFSDATLKILITNIMYGFDCKPLNSQTYKVDAATENLFTNHPKDLLFYQDDIHKLNLGNDYDKVKFSNDVLNEINKKLSEKDIKLIVLISPDKYDLYYPYISDNNHCKNLQKPLFFDYFTPLEKSYLYINSKGVLTESIKKYKDLYYYDDSHWSPVATELIAKEIEKLIKQDKSTNAQPRVYDHGS